MASDSVEVTFVGLIGLQVLLLMSGIGAVDVSADRCPSGLPRTTTMRVFGDRCYQFVSEERYWDGARDYCIQYGGRLVKIGNAETNKFLVDTLNDLWWQNNGVWIGLHDQTVEMRWQWISTTKTSNEPATWFNWARGHPRAFMHTIRDCVRMTRSGGRWLWHETPCSSLSWRYRFICEYGQHSTNPPPMSTTRPWTSMASVFMTNHGKFQLDFYNRLQFGTTSDILHASSDIVEDQISTTPSDVDSPPFDSPLLPFAMQSLDKQQPVVSNVDRNTGRAFGVVSSIIAVACVVLLLFYLARKHHRSKLFFAAGNDEPYPENVKSDADLTKKSQSPSLLPTTTGTLRRAESNLYEDLDTTVARALDVAQSESTVLINQAMTGSAVITGTVPDGVSIYCPMDGTQQAMATTTAVGRPRMDIPASFYLPMKNGLPEYKNCCDDDDDVRNEYANEGNNDDKMAAKYKEVRGGSGGEKLYDMPRPSNVYAEIPDSSASEAEDDGYEKCHIYESINHVKLPPRT